MDRFKRYRYLITTIFSNIAFIYVSICFLSSTGNYKGTLTSKSEDANSSSHSFSDSEKQAFSEHINICLSHDPLVKDLLPLDINSMDLFEKSNNGLILCKLINVAVVDSIDERALNTKPDMNIYQKSGKSVSS